jgi:hypothetical protein
VASIKISIRINDELLSPRDENLVKVSLKVQFEIFSVNSCTRRRVVNVVMDAKCNRPAV